MKKALLTLTALVLFAPMLFAGFSLKLCGGMTTFQGGDFDLGQKGFMDFWGTFAEDNAGSFTGNLSGLAKAGMNFALEVLYDITPRLGFGLGTGYFATSAKEDSFSFEGADGWNWREITVTNKAKVGVIPIVLSVHNYLPLGSRFKLDIFAGPGLYLTDFRYEDELDSDAWLIGIFHSEDLVVTADFKANKIALGFQGGLGFEFEVAPRISVFFSGLFRYLSVGGLKGDGEQVYEDFMAGTTFTMDWDDAVLWIYEAGYLGHSYPMLMIDETAPSGANISGVDQAKLNLSGFVLQGGIKVRFGAI